MKTTVQEKPKTQKNDDGTSRRDVLKSIGKAAYIAPATIALLVSTRASASP